MIYPHQFDDLLEELRICELDYRDFMRTMPRPPHMTDVDRDDMQRMADTVRQHRKEVYTEIAKRATEIAASF
jgi:hypothetical protein